LKTLLILDSPTCLSRAVRVLSSVGVVAEKRKIDSVSGCTHALLISNIDYFRAVSALSGANLNYRVKTPE
jgi:hypothetical protein